MASQYKEIKEAICYMTKLLSVAKLSPSVGIEARELAETWFKLKEITDKWQKK